MRRWRRLGVRFGPTLGRRGRKSNSRKRFLTVLGHTRRPCVPITSLAISVAVLNLLRRCTRRIRLSWRCVVTRGRPLLGRSVNLPVALRRWTNCDIVASCTPNCCATSRCDRPYKIRAIALPLSSFDKRTISLNKLKQQTFCATDTNGTKVRFGNVLKSLPRDTTRAARI